MIRGIMCFLEVVVIISLFMSLFLYRIILANLDLSCSSLGLNYNIEFWKYVLVQVIVDFDVDFVILYWNLMIVLNSMLNLFDYFLFHYLLKMILIYVYKKNELSVQIHLQQMFFLLKINLLIMLLFIYLLFSFLCMFSWYSLNIIKNSRLGYIGRIFIKNYFIVYWIDRCHFVDYSKFLCQVWRVSLFNMNEVIKCFWSRFLIIMWLII